MFEPNGERLASVTSELSGRIPRLVRSDDEEARLKVMLVSGRLDLSTTGSVLLSPPTTFVEPRLSVKSLRTSRTMMVNDWVALRTGEPLSATTMAIGLVLGPWVLSGVQRKMPFVAFRVAPAGTGPSRE